MVYEGAFKTKLPHTGSHEPTGTIAALGPDVSGEWKVGDRVGVYLFTNPCGSCSGCKWYSATFGQKPKARYCDNRTMCGIVGTDGGFAEYMLAHDEAVVKIPEEVSFEQAAPMMCAGATVWNGILEANLQKGQTLAIVGIGALGLLGIQFAKALGYRVVAVRNRDLTQIQEAEVSPALRPDLTVNPKDETSIQQILDFTDGIGLHPAVVCNDKGDDKWTGAC
ncbi:hypothetical protein H2203_009291 [Taxawa tesnikishii (nom. ined.)]|nr:hypothetical protein H2203_009291 [Dothideales sp. JES 119]